MLRTTINSEMIAALKAHNSKKLNIYRNLLAQIKNIEIDKKAELNDGEVVQIIKKQIKNLSEANILYEKGGRADLVFENKTEIDLLGQYLPTEISEADLTEKIKTILAQNENVNNFGQLIGLCVKELKDVADGSRISTIIKKLKS